MGPEAPHYGITSRKQRRAGRKALKLYKKGGRSPWWERLLNWWKNLS